VISFLFEGADLSMGTALSIIKFTLDISNSF
jgi:hypothetical protein